MSDNKKDEFTYGVTELGSFEVKNTPFEIDDETHRALINWFYKQPLLRWIESLPALWKRD